MRAASVNDRGAGKGATVVVEREIRDTARDVVYCTLQQTPLLRADSGFGGAPPPHRPSIVPDRARDATTSFDTERRSISMLWSARRLAIVALALGVTSVARAQDAACGEPSLPADARDAVRDYATNGGRVPYRGTSATRLDGATFVVVVDFGAERDMMFLLLRQFVDDKGAKYWKASAVDPTSAALFGDRIRPQ